MRLLIAFAAVACGLGAEFAKVDTSTAVGRAFVRMYEFDFPGANAILDREILQHPEDPVPYSAKAAALLFAEMDRLKILQIDFFEDDDRVIDRSRLTPDPAARTEFFRLIEESRRRAAVVLAARPEDREALFAEGMCAGLVTDYAALVERRRLGSFSLAKQSQVYVQKLLALDPPYHDAHLTAGAVEYVVGSLYFFVRWFVRIQGIQGDKAKAMEHLRIVAEQGRYYGPFARVLMAVIHLREKRPGEAERLLAGLQAEFPGNLLFRRELARARQLAGTPPGPASSSSSSSGR